MFAFDYISYELASTVLEVDIYSYNIPHQFRSAIIRYAVL